MDLKSEQLKKKHKQEAKIETAEMKFFINVADYARKVQIRNRSECF
jgi:hypothetical protein